jgi:hypothetical protein
VFTKTIHWVESSSVITPMTRYTLATRGQQIVDTSAANSADDCIDASRCAQPFLPPGRGDDGAGAESTLAAKPDETGPQESREKQQE